MLLVTDIHKQNLFITIYFASKVHIHQSHTLINPLLISLIQFTNKNNHLHIATNNCTHCCHLQYKSDINTNVLQRFRN